MRAYMKNISHPRILDEKYLESVTLASVTFSPLMLDTNDTSQIILCWIESCEYICIYIYILSSTSNIFIFLVKISNIFMNICIDEENTYK